ncbi:GLPGLI family protein [Chitinophaga sp. 180180018-2]|nr:GLPGLI family protein [Chitinophaga sp. 212800010-3]
MLATGILLSVTGWSQVIKTKQPPDPVTDSIIYQTENVTMIFDRQVLYEYMLSKDTALRNSQYNNRVFNSVTFARLNAVDMGNHFRKAFCYLEDSTNKDFAYSTGRMNMLWAEDGGIMAPYVEELLPDLLAAGTVRVIDRSSKALQPSYKMIAEPIQGNNYRVFRLNSGKEIFRESTFRVEQLTKRY